MLGAGGSRTAAGRVRGTAYDRAGEAATRWPPGGRPMAVRWPPGNEPAAAGQPFTRLAGLTDD
ncbi:hypothetical protein AN217_06600 [Streptomyces qinglanensis]|uniref:Uncharacterized protein n=1 Tax=Streptomyces qinglanensis TaxID=943816 RepID=A0A1E7K0Z8_9ACTN|nr:hypothetical protein AN217_06600 [Streptomyces qinglanensis]OEV28017.1 hypothetical protein AN220_03175 [Streptomyces nanshensis]OEV28018.1 hypothetical protein AN220_03185 [Streptomyces nanshensis]